MKPSSDVRHGDKIKSSKTDDKQIGTITILGTRVLFDFPFFI